MGDGGANGEEKESTLDPYWFCAGFLIAFVLAAKYAKFKGYANDQIISGEPAIIFAILLFGPPFALGAVGQKLRNEVDREKITWATYWTTTVSTFVAVLTLVGITNVDDLFSVLNGI
ncbi:hypothetical protein [Streptomyces sp. NPDC001948]